MLEYNGIAINGGHERQFTRTQEGDAAWERATYDVLIRVFCTHVGAAVRAYLDLTGKRVTIAPEVPNTWPGAAPVVYEDAYLQGHSIRWPTGPQVGRVVPPGQSWAGNRVGTGVGSDSTLRIDVERLPRARIPWTPEEVLLHELVHSLRHASGVLDNGPLRYDFQTFEEFAAITVQNMFASELRRSRRADHSPTRPNRIRGDIAWPTEWGRHPRIEFERQNVARMHRQMPGFTTRLQLIARNICPHNPFVDFMYHPVSGWLPIRTPPEPAARGRLEACVMPPDTERGP
jgi:hypothetical protein